MTYLFRTSATFGSALCVLLLCAGCDRFFVVQGSVTRCADDVAVPDVLVHGVLVDGASDEEIVDERTDAKGAFTLFLNEPDTAKVRVTFTHEGFAREQELYDGAPGKTVTICLETEEDAAQALAERE